MREWLARLIGGAPLPPTARTQTCRRPEDSPAEQRLAAATENANSKIEEAEAETRRVFATLGQRSSNPLGNLLADRGK